ncbi:Uncharacterized protein SCG7086_AS_00140 [Chlamydiales bacterium SCGC AG-110-P3]|nr:Uncharacterized protein SCG7086_AS_00140 [Chlamydiales bacterium SCGC AG-110-P3]
MNSEALGWLALNLLTLIIMSFFSMIEMACVSFNRVRLQYYVSKGHRRAIWLNWLMQKPSRLFGTTLIGVNVTMMIGSECSRQFYESLGFLPEIAPLTQVLIVIVVGELAPMFAARRHPEHVTMLGMPLLYASAKLLGPVLAAIELITHGLNRLFGGGDSLEHDIFITRDDLQKIIEEQDDSTAPITGTEDFNTIVAHIFTLRDKQADQIMEPIRPLHMLPSNATIAHMRHIMLNSNLPYLTLFHQRPNNVVGIVFPRDLIRAGDTDLVRHHARPPWFITKNSRIIEVLGQFRRNKQSLAVVLDTQGRAVGTLSLDAVLQEIFGRVERQSNDPLTPDCPLMQRVVERTVSGDMLVSEFATEFEIDLEGGHETMSQLLTKVLGHTPDPGEFIVLSPLKLLVKETTLTGAKTISVTSHR